jgi:hypothetical protein
VFAGAEPVGGMQEECDGNGRAEHHHACFERYTVTVRSLSVTCEQYSQPILLPSSILYSTAQHSAHTLPYSLNFGALQHPSSRDKQASTQHPAAAATGVGRSCITPAAEQSADQSPHVHEINVTANSSRIQCHTTHFLIGPALPKPEECRGH